MNASFVICEEQKHGIAEIFPCFPRDRVVVSSKGIDLDVFKKSEKDLAQAVPSAADLEKYKRCITFGGKAAEWKRQASMLRATAMYEKGKGQSDRLKVHRAWPIVFCV